jgi:hypothetical protein
MRHQSGLWIAVAALLTSNALAGCGASPASSALHDPTTQGVEALRQAIRSALQAHDDQRQCELFSPILLERFGGTIAICVKGIKEVQSNASLQAAGYIPYDIGPGGYVAGGRIEMVGNLAVYNGGGGEIFRAVYTEAHGGSPAANGEGRLSAGGAGGPGWRAAVRVGAPRARRVGG